MKDKDARLIWESQFDSYTDMVDDEPSGWTHEGLVELSVIELAELLKEDLPSWEPTADPERIEKLKDLLISAAHLILDK